MADQNLENQFDKWAPTYDYDVQDEEGFPFAGYRRILDRVVSLARIEAGLEILELGAGTGTLTRKLLDAGAAVWAIDFSAEMLAIARQKAPRAHFGQANLLADYPSGFVRPYAHIVSTYTFHEFPLADKVKLLQRLSEHYLAPGGNIIIGDIGFVNVEAREAMRIDSGEAWDDEYYWIQDETETALKSAGLRMMWEQHSRCGLVMEVSCLPG